MALKVLVLKGFPMAKCARGQGATEYLVLLAVVLIVALVSVALLGFFPGMASDAQITQSRAYWQSAQPVSIVESGARVLNSQTWLYLRFRNSGAYPIRITGIVGADGLKATTFNTPGSCGAAAGYNNIADFFYLGPGEEKYIASWHFYAACDWDLYAMTSATDSRGVGGAASVCSTAGDRMTVPGTLDYKTFGFEYIEYLDNNQQITKRQIGKELIVKCLPPV